eukprot:403377434
MHYPVQNNNTQIYYEQVNQNEDKNEENPSEDNSFSELTKPDFERMSQFQLHNSQKVYAFQIKSLKQKVRNLKKKLNFNHLDGLEADQKKCCFRMRNIKFFRKFGVTAANEKEKCLFNQERSYNNLNVNKKINNQSPSEQKPQPNDDDIAIMFKFTDYKRKIKKKFIDLRKSELKFNERKVMTVEDIKAENKPYIQKFQIPTKQSWGNRLHNFKKIQNILSLTENNTKIRIQASSLFQQEDLQAFQGDSSTQKLICQQDDAKMGNQYSFQSSQHLTEMDLPLSSDSQENQKIQSNQYKNKIDLATRTQRAGLPIFAYYELQSKSNDQIKNQQSPSSE